MTKHKARQQLICGSFITQEEGLALAERMRTGDQAHTALVEGNLRYVVTNAGAFDRNRGSKSFLWANLEEISDSPGFRGKPLTY